MWLLSRPTYDPGLSPKILIGAMSLIISTTIAPESSPPELNPTAMDGSGSHKAKVQDSFFTCKRCKQTYTSSSNTPDSCRYHPSFFVCRRHDDQKRYYELRADDPPYAAKFYDCCGAENPGASGCTTGYHISYDDN